MISDDVASALLTLIAIALFPLSQPLCQSCVQFPLLPYLSACLSIIYPHGSSSLIVKSLLRASLLPVCQGESEKRKAGRVGRVSISSSPLVRDNLSLLSFTGPLFPPPPSFCSVARARTTENQSCPFFLNSNGPSLSRTSSSRDIDLKKEKDQGKSDISRNFSSKLNFTLGDREFAMSFLCFPFFFFF